MLISIITFDDFTDLDLFILWDLLKRVQKSDWRVMLLGDKESHISSTGIEIKMHGSIETANESDAVLFGSGRGTRAKMEDDAYISRFKLDEKRQLIGALDSGALLLGKLGFLKGRKVTAYPSEETKKLLGSFGAEVSWQSFVEQGNIATAAQCLAGQNLVAWVIKRLIDSKESKRVLESAAALDELKITF
jgi:transcriptional regulator GlxA family with amidase domain